MSMAITRIPGPPGSPGSFGPADASACIGVFDSGLGGLSIVRELAALLPHECIYYYADNVHLPYGPRPLEEVRRFATSIAGRLIQLPAKIVVVACNTASAASLKHLRKIYPHTYFVGMEPAVKPAAAGSRSGKVGVLATQATFQGELFESVVERFATGVEVICQPCPGLAEFIENHQPDHPVLNHMLTRFIQPLVEQGVDTIVLACTHYSLVKESIGRVAGPGVTIIDPSPAIAKRTEQVLHEANLLRKEGEGSVGYYVSGETENFSKSVSAIMGCSIRAEKSSFRWIPVDQSDVIWNRDE